VPGRGRADVRIVFARAVRRRGNAPVVPPESRHALIGRPCPDGSVALPRAAYH
jgi:hypothetical protein